MMMIIKDGFGSFSVDPKVSPYDDCEATTEQTADALAWDAVLLQARKIVDDLIKSL